MIAKGASRNNPRQLAVYLMRVERYATGEPVALLEFQSAWARGLDLAESPDGVWRVNSPLFLQQTAAKLIEGFRDWQVLTEGTKQGRDGLYHAEISPEGRYADTMTPEQWKRAADILGEELGLQGQPRAVVLHGGTDGRKHLHVVWARTDIEEMKLVSDSYNYVAHEKASQRMELEFGQEFVPGKHAKRDRDKQPEFPRQDFDFAEAQISDRSPLGVGERKEEIRTLLAAAANGLEFRKGLEKAGYVLAQGERGYVVVDEAGVYSALTKNLQGVMKKGEVEAFMADVPLSQLPTVEDARARQKEKALSSHHKEQSEHAGPTDAERKEKITTLRKQADTAQAFKNALEESGYILARGDKRGFVVVDDQGEVFSLSRYVTDIKGKEFKAFMASLDAATLPDVEQAKALRTERPANGKETAQEASKFLSPEHAEKLLQPPPAPEKSKFLPPEVAAKVETPKPDAQSKPDQVQLTPVAPEQPPADRLKTKGYEYAAYAPTELPTAFPIENRRAPLPSDPWMAQTGGVDNLSPAHLESAQNSYEKWPNKGRYDFANYVAYVQRQWENKELPPPPSHTEAPAAPEAPQRPAEPGKKKGYDYGAYSPQGPVRGPVTVPAPPPPPAPPQPKVPDLAEGPKPTWIKERGPHVPITPKQPGVNFDTYAPKAPEPVAPAAPDVRDQKLKEEFQKPAAAPPPKPEPTIDPEIEVIRKRIFARQQAENRKFLQLYAAEERETVQAIERMAENIATANAEKVEVFDFQQREALHAELQRHAPRKGVREALRKFFKPEDEEAKAAERQEEMDLFRSQQAHDRRAYIKSLEESRDDTLNRMRDQLKALRDEHQAEQRERNKGYDNELARRLRERQKAIDLAREQSGWDKEFEKEQEQRWDDPDVPRRGK
jgi:hypothetical protein